MFITPFHGTLPFCARFQCTGQCGKGPFPVPQGVVARVVTLPSGSDPGNPLTSVVSGLLNGDVSWCSILQGVNPAVALLQIHWCGDAAYNAATLGHSYTLCGSAEGRI